MKGKATVFVLALVGVVLVSSFVLADESPKIKLIGVLGKGIAISSTNPADFKIIKVGVARMLLSSVTNATEVNAGVLHLDNDAYKLKNIVIGNGTVSGDIYSNNTSVGTFSLSRTEKQDGNIWYGQLVINGQTWNAYILEGERPAKVSEAADNIQDACSGSPDKCRELVLVAGSRIKQYCSQNPTDAKCISMYREYCKNNQNDSRCFEELKSFCSSNKGNQMCQGFCQKHSNVCALKQVVSSAKRISANTTIEAD